MTMIFFCFRGKCRCSCCLCLVFVITLIYYFKYNEILHFGFIRNISGGCQLFGCFGA